MAQQAATRRDSRNFVFDEISPSSAWTDDGNCHYLLIDVPGFKKEWLKLQVDDDAGYIKASGERQESENKIVHFEQNFKLPENSDIRKISGRYEGEILYVIVPKLVKEEERESQNRIAEAMEEKHKHVKEEEEKNVKGTANVVDKKPEQVKEDEKHVKGTANVVEEKHEHLKEKSAKETTNVVEEKHEHGKKEEEKHVKGSAYVGEDKHEHRKQHDGVHGYHRESNENRRTVTGENFYDANSNMWRQEAGLLGSVVKILNKNKGIIITVVLAFSLGVLVSQRFQSNIGTERPLSPV